MKYKTTFSQTPNISSKPINPKGIVLHHTAGSYVGSVAWCLNPASKVSYHNIVNVDGNRTQIAKDTQRAWHAGKSSFRGYDDCNSFMLGIAVSGDTYKRLLTSDEVLSVALWCIDKMRQYNIPLDWVTTHREIAPNRKVDIDPRAEKMIKDKIIELL